MTRTIGPRVAVDDVVPGVRLEDMAGMTPERVAEVERIQTLRAIERNQRRLEATIAKLERRPR